MEGRGAAKWEDTGAVSSATFGPKRSGYICRSNRFVCRSVANSTADALEGDNVRTYRLLGAVTAADAAQFRP